MQPLTLADFFQLFLTRHIANVVCLGSNSILVRFVCGFVVNCCNLLRSKSTRDVLKYLVNKSYYLENGAR